jgi:predicted GTPase
MAKRKVVIMGAAGRDFHNFNVFFRDNPDYDVMAFTATQIPDIAGRTYPPELAGKLYPAGIGIIPESDLTRIIDEGRVDEVVFAYSDVPHEYVMHRASMVLAHGADFRMMGPNSTMLSSNRPVVAVTAVRTGAGKSQTTRKVASILREAGRRVVVIRHPMPYGNLLSQAVMRFEDYSDLDKHNCTIEEREEFEPHIDAGSIVFAGVDYQRILDLAEKEADVILWDGGNNDLPFYRPDIHIVLVDPHRPGHEIRYHPGETNLRMAHIVVINKVDTADPRHTDQVRRTIRNTNPAATVIEAASPVFVDNPSLVTGKRVLVVEDGPTLTHGEMAYGAGVIAARKFGASEIVDPRPAAVGSLREVFDRFTQIENLVPAMGYSPMQVKELEQTINTTDCDTVMIATPINLGRIARITRPSVRVRYEFQEIGVPTLKEVLLRMMGGQAGVETEPRIYPHLKDVGPKWPAPTGPRY